MIFFSSDHHFGHKNIIEHCKRPFSSVEEMDRKLIELWNERVTDQDTVYYLGDFSLSKAFVEPILKQLRGKKYLIAGNHDHCHPAHAKNLAKLERMKEFYLTSGFDSVKFSDSIELAGQTVLLSHLPYDEDYLGRSKYDDYRPINEGQWLLHGHVHDKWKNRGRMINVGADVWGYKPASLLEIEELMGTSFTLENR